MKFGIVKDWMTESGLRGVIYMTPLGHHCGYVGVPENHPAFNLDYSVDALEDIEVHGGITFSSKHERYPACSYHPVRWFGFDCGHYGDIPSPEYHATLNEKMQKYSCANDEGIFRDVEFCTKECESLAKQLLILVRVTKWSES